MLMVEPIIIWYIGKTKTFITRISVTNSKILKNINCLLSLEHVKKGKKE